MITFRKHHHERSAWIRSWQNFYVWRASDDFAIHLSLQVVTQLNAQIRAPGSESQPVGLRGILLGRTIETPFRAAVIEDLLLGSAGEAGIMILTGRTVRIARRMAEAAERTAVVGFFGTGVTAR